jgi:hypothetical protein
VMKAHAATIKIAYVKTGNLTEYDLCGDCLSRIILELIFWNTKRDEVDDAET